MSERTLAILWLLFLMSIPFIVMYGHYLIPSGSPKVDYAEIRDVVINGQQCFRLMETGLFTNYTMAVCGDVIFCYNCAAVAKVDGKLLTEVGTRIGTCGPGCDVFKASGRCYALNYISTCK